MKRQLKVALLVDSILSWSAGTEKQLLLLHLGLQRRGHESCLFALRHTELTRRQNGFSVEIDSLGVESLRSLASLRKLRRFKRRLRDEGFQILQTFFPDSALVGPAFLSQPGLSVITSRRDMGISYSPIRLMLLRRLVHRTAWIVCNSQAVADVVTKKEWSPDSKCAVIPNALEQVSIDEKKIAHWPGFNADDCNVVIVANIKPIKGLADVVLAAARIQRRNRLKFWIIGMPMDKAYANELDSKCEELGLKDSVNFLGHAPEPLSYVSRCQIGLLTSKSEGLSNSIMEYMAAGLPVIASNVGGNAELVRPGENGFLYESGDDAELARLLLQLSENPQLRCTLGQAGKDRVESEFSVERMIQQYEDIYRSSI